MFAAWERFTKAAKFARAGKTRFSRTKQKLAKLTEVEEQIKEVAKDQTQQSRGHTSADEAKVRVCSEARQAILNYFRETEAPKGVVVPSVLTVHGAHARLSNIDDKHRYINSEQFYVGEKLVKREVGTKIECL